jgi:hypothetical protein
MAFVALTFLLMPTFLWSQESATDLAKKLGSSNYTERERAASLLEQMGKAAVPALEVAAAKGDLETRRRAILLIDRIEERAIVAGLMKGTPTRIQLNDVAIPDAVRQIENLYGFQCGPVRTKNRLFNFDSSELPYWQAWQRFCEAAQLEEADYSLSAAKLRRLSPDIIDGFRELDRERRTPFTTPRIVFHESGTRTRWSSDDSRSVRVRVRKLHTDCDLVPGTPHLVFAVEVRAESRLEITSTPKVTFTKLLDVQGKEIPAKHAELVPASAAADDVAFFSAYAGETQFGGLLHLKAMPWPDADRVVSEVQGTIQFDVAVAPHAIEIPNAFKAAGKTARSLEGVAIKVTDFDTSDSGDHVLYIRLSDIESLTPQTPQDKIVRVRPGFTAVRGAIDVALDRLVLFDARGRKYRIEKTPYTRDGNDFLVEIHFAPRSVDDAPTLVLTKSTRVTTVTMPFAARGLSAK